MSNNDGTIIKVKPNFSYTGVSEKNNETGDTQNANVEEQKVKSEETKDFSNSHSHNPNTNPKKKKANPSPNPRKNSAYYQNQCVEDTPPPILIDTDVKSKVFKAQDFSNSFVVLILFHHAWDYQGTKEMESFSEHVEKFKDQNCKLLGVSRDGPSVLKDWMDECGWPIPVISDMNLAPKDFGIIQRLGLPLQHGYAVPSAVVIDKKGVIRTIASHSPSDGGCCVGEILRIVTALNQVVVPGDNGKLTPANWDAKQPFIVNTRKGVDDYYYRKYGLREKKYWPTSPRSESKGGINNGSKEEKGAIQENGGVGGNDKTKKEGGTKEKNDEAKNDKVGSTNEKNKEAKNDKVGVSNKKNEEGKSNKVGGTNEKNDEGKNEKVGGTNERNEADGTNVNIKEGKDTKLGGTNEQNEEGKSDKGGGTNEKNEKEKNIKGQSQSTNEKKEEDKSETKGEGKSEEVGVPNEKKEKDKSDEIGAVEDDNERKHL